MRQALSKAAIESEIASRFHSAFKPRAKASEVISAGVVEVDALTGGLPRGAITEIFGPASSGRTSLMLATLAHATTHDEVCALIDTNNTFDPKSAANAQMDLDRLLWVRCDGKLEHAFKAADLLLQGGGFGLVVLDLGDVPASEARRIISSWWYRFRRVVENKPTALVVIAADTCVRSCAAMTLEMKKDLSVWSTASNVIAEIDHHQSYRPVILKASGYRVARQKPIGLLQREVQVYASSNPKEQILSQKRSLRLA